MLRLPAIAAKQGTRLVVTAKISLNQLVKEFEQLPTDIPTELKQQRDLNSARANAVKKYLLNSKDYFFNGVVAIVNGGKFNPSNVPSGSPNVDFGTFEIDESCARFLIDGQGRLGGIKLGIEQGASCGEDFIDILLLDDEGLDANRRIFVDLNKNAAKTSKAINIAFDTREVVSRFTKYVLDSLPDIKAKVDYERTSVSGGSDYLWTINQFASFLRYFTGLTDKQMADVFTTESEMQVYAQQVAMFFDALRHNEAWSLAVSGELPAKTVRSDYVHGTAILMESLGLLGNQIFSHAMLQEESPNWEQATLLSAVSLKRDAKHWQNRCVDDSYAMLKNTRARNLTAIFLTSKIAVPVSDDLAMALAA